METTESLESLNRQLIDLYGIDTVTGQAMWRIVWSEDQFEHRYGTYDDITETGIYLRTITETRYVPKYRQWIKEKYVLERLVVIPEVSMPELPATRTSYEPMYPFQTASGQYLPPSLINSKFIIDTVLAAQGKKSLAKYKDPASGITGEENIELKSKEIEVLQKELFGNESPVGDAMAHGEAIIVPRNYEKES